MIKQLQKAKENFIIERIDLNHPYIEKMQDKTLRLEKDNKILNGQIEELIKIIKREQSKINRIRDILK